MKLNISVEINTDYLIDSELDKIRYIVDYIENNIPSSEAKDVVMNDLYDSFEAACHPVLRQYINSDINNVLAKEYYDKLADQYDYYNHYASSIESEAVEKEIDIEF